MSALNDIDVIYHDATESDPDANLRWESILEEILPGHCWQVRNQALMHMRNGHQPYQSSAQAMRHWPEIETAVGVRIDTDARLAINAPFGTSSLEKGFLTANPNAPFELFRQRVQKKHWLERWPKLKIRDASSMAGPSSSTEA